MKITFILPGFINVPMGGVKVVNEYANHLANRGHIVALIYPLKLQTANPVYFLRKKLTRILDKIHGVTDDLYYTPGAKVSALVVRNIAPRYIPDGDAVVAVGWQTASAVNNLPPEHGRKFYLLQSFETYFSKSGRILATYHLPLKKIAISRWIMDEMSKIGEECDGPLENAVDPNEFYIENPDGDRLIDVMMMYHSHPIKGAKDGIAVLKQLKTTFPDLKAVLVAPRQPVHRISGWIDVVLRPSIEELRHFYNSSKIFLHTSHWEGWGLPVMEAMACGCAVVASGNSGVMEFLHHSENALISPIGDIPSLTQDLSKLLQKSDLRKSLSEAGAQLVQNYSWDKIIDQLENIIAKP